MRVADVGCGTGLASRQLAGLGAHVTGVEPNDDMRARAKAHGTHERLEYVTGTAEATGLACGSRDVVVCSQSFHWFDPERSPEEFHRVLRPGGRLALFWKRIREDNPIRDAYKAISDAARVEARERSRAVRFATVEDLARSPRFTNLRSMQFPQAHLYDRDGFVGRAASASYFPRAGALYADLVARLGALFDAHAQDGRVELEGLTEVFLLDRVDG